VTTKREVLHCIARVFDPLGLLAPVFLIGKLFPQKLWKIDQPWDEPLPEDLSREWHDISAILREIPSLSVSRFVRSSSKGINQLLIFSDASVHCYATAVYLRTVEENSTTVKHDSFQFLRGRIKIRNCSRLELTGVLIGVRAANFVAAELKITITK